MVLGKDGIKFASSVHEHGENAVIFDYSKFECYKVKKARIVQVKL